MEAAARGECLPECKQYAGNPKCCRFVTDDDVCSRPRDICVCSRSGMCSADCQEKSFWGECPKRCKEFEGDPDCCAPTCPAKCTNRRRGECGAGGVPECDGIPGCCPEHFDIVFGAGVYLPAPGLGSVAAGEK